jgi:hypothetical protein
MLFDRQGQTQTEYIIILAGVMLAATAIIALFRTISRRFEDTDRKLQGIE